MPVEADPTEAPGGCGVAETQRLEFRVQRLGFKDFEVRGFTFRFRVFYRGFGRWITFGAS